MLKQVADLLAPQPGDRVLDVTVGLGGHAATLLEAVGPTGFLLGFDADPTNLDIAAGRLGKIGSNFRLLHGDFREAAQTLEGIHEGPVNRLLADFGVSTNQLDDPERGFSFRLDGPLDMRFDRRGGTTAADLVNRLSEKELADLIYVNSQERFSRRIAKQICRARRDRRITTTQHLARVVCQALKVDPESRREKIHPATRTFQSLRIAVNRELQAIRSLLEQAPALLAENGRIAAISFHSLEDRLVKDDFRRRKQQGLYRLITKKPVVADAAERERNPRSRSSKLRVAERTDRPIETT